MLLKDKIVFIQKALNLTDKEFAKRYALKRSVDGFENPSSHSIELICSEFNLDVNDFIDDSSTLLKEVKNNERPCKLATVEECHEVIYEDFPREDNSRYEERD